MESVTSVQPVGPVQSVQPVQSVIAEQLAVRNVRNIASGHLHLDAGVNALTGPNGAGKTATLEALHLLLRGRSFRTPRAEELIRHGEDYLRVDAELRNTHGDSLRLSYRRQRGRTELQRDGIPVRQSSTVADLLPIQLILPNIAELAFGAPSLRRQWLDWGVFHMKPSYMGALRDYQRTLRHRNALLRRGGRSEARTLAVWSARLAEMGEAVAAMRAAYFASIESRIVDCVQALSPELAVQFSLYPGWNGATLLETLEQQQDRDVKSAMTNAGPHRADIAMRIGTQLASQVLSRGQGKILACAMRVAQAQSLESSGKRSLFLIDDVGAELDRAHNARFYALLDGMGCQIIATSAHPDAGGVLQGPRAGRMFHVKRGCLTAG